MFPGRFKRVLFQCLLGKDTNNTVIDEQGGLLPCSPSAERKNTHYKEQYSEAHTHTKGIRKHL